MQAFIKTFSGFCPEKWNVKFSMHGLHNRYPEEKCKMIAVSHKLLEQVKLVATEVDFHKHKTTFTWPVLRCIVTVYG